MDGLTLGTEDGWILYVGIDQATALVEAGVIRCSDFTERDIKDRAKADTLAKTCTVCQSTCVTVDPGRARRVRPTHYAIRVCDAVVRWLCDHGVRLLVEEAAGYGGTDHHPSATQARRYADRDQEGNGRTPGSLDAPARRSVK
jgi:hypothetical protein